MTQLGVLAQSLQKINDVRHEIISLGKNCHGHVNFGGQAPGGQTGDRGFHPGRAGSFGCIPAIVEPPQRLYSLLRFP
jgi:hypothetical protein